MKKVAYDYDSTAKVKFYVSSINSEIFFFCKLVI